MTIEPYKLRIPCVFAVDDSKSYCMPSPVDIVLVVHAKSGEEALALMQQRLQNVLEATVSHDSWFHVELDRDTPHRMRGVERERTG